MMTDFDSSSTANIAWVKMYAGTLEVRISLPVISVDGEVTAPAASRLLASIANLKAAGFAEMPENAKEGERILEINQCVVTTFTNDKGSVPLVFYYQTEDHLVKASAKDYLNTEEEIAAFERNTGLRLSELTRFPGDSAPERGNPKSAPYFYSFAPVRIAQIPNPKYKPEFAKEPLKAGAKYLFSRWLSDPLPKQTPPTPAAGQPQAQPAGSEPGKPSGVSDEQNWDKAKPLLAAIFPKGGISHAQHVFKLLQDAGIVDKKDGVTSAIKKMTMYRDCRENGSLPEKPTADQITAAFAALAESQMADGADIAF